MIVTKILFSQKVNNNSLKRRDTVNLLDARTAGVKRKPRRKPVASDDIDYICHDLIGYNTTASQSSPAPHQPLFSAVFQAVRLSHQNQSLANISKK